jgi:hypothetical protein
VRIEGLQVKQPVGRFSVAVEKRQSRVEAAHRREVLVGAHGLPVDDVIGKLVPSLLGELRRVVLLLQPLPRGLNHGLPRITLLATDEFVGVVTVVVRGSAVAPVVVVVGDQVRVDPSLVQQGGERVVEGLQRAPPAVQEIEPTGVHVAPCWHAGQAAHIVAVKRDSALREPLEIRCLDRGATVGLQGKAVERIEQQEDGLHRGGT